MLSLYLEDMRADSGLEVAELRLILLARRPPPRLDDAKGNLPLLAATEAKPGEEDEEDALSRLLLFAVVELLLLMMGEGGSWDRDFFLKGCI